jgi:hypothetical protein
MGFYSAFKWLREVHKAEEVQEHGTEENEEEVIGYIRKLRNEELHNFEYPSNIISVIRSWTMRWAVNVERMQTRKIRTKIR